MHRLTCLPLLFVLVAGAAPRAHGDDLTSASFTLRGAHVSSSGVARMTSTSFTVGAASGQSEPLDAASNGVDLRTIAPGFWPIVAGGFATLDIDDDGLPALTDNCPFWANPLQTPSLDFPWVGLACLCGDVNDDGAVDTDDRDDIRDALADPFGFPVTAPEKCTVRGLFGPCSVLDTTVIMRDFAARPPFIQQACEAANIP